MRTLTLMEMDAVAGGEGANGKSFAQNFGQCVIDTATGAAVGGTMGGTLGAVVVAIIANLRSEACNALPSPY